MSYREIIEPLLREVGEHVLRLRREGLTIEEKADGSMVTNADKAASEMLTAALRKAYPEVGIVSEEHADLSGLESGHFWIMDPIDGTKHFARGGNMFNIMIALVDKTPLFSMVYYPVLRRWYWAERGKGAFMKEHGKVIRLRLREPGKPYQVVYGSNCPHVVGEEGTLGVVKYFTKIVHGKKDAYIRVNTPYWDLIPPALILTEAGGVVKDFAGNDIAFHHGDAHQPEVLAGHPAVVDFVQGQIRS